MVLIGSLGGVVVMGEVENAGVAGVERGLGMGWLVKNWCCVR